VVSAEDEEILDGSQPSGGFQVVDPLVRGHEASPNTSATSRSRTRLEVTVADPPIGEVVLPQPPRRR
jgi:hypothetical protein